MKNADPIENLAPSQLISKQIAELADWRGSIMTRLRDLIHQAAPDLREEWKWGTAVWYRNGNVVSTCAFRDHVKLNFFKGSLLDEILKYPPLVRKELITNLLSSPTAPRELRATSRWGMWACRIGPLCSASSTAAVSQRGANVA